MEQPNEMQQTVDSQAIAENVPVKDIELQNNVEENNIPSADTNTNNSSTETEPVSVEAEHTPSEGMPISEEAEPTKSEEEQAEPEVDYSQMSREELVAALKELLDEETGKIRNRVGSIRTHFLALTKELHAAENQNEAPQQTDSSENSEEEQESQPTENFRDELADEFRQLYDTYRAKRQKMLEEIEAQKARNYEAKKQLLEDLRALIDRDNETLKQTYDEFTAIQEKWKTIGDVPREHMNDLWQNYHFLIEQFFNKVKINKELRMLDLKKNLEQKLLLCEKAEELIVETSITKAFKTLQNLRNQWREIGPVPTEHNEETWQRFNAAASQIDERRREYYEQRKEEMDQNMLAKQALIEKAEELTQETPQSTKAWNDTSSALDELLKLWRSIGPVPREQNEEIWSHFKGILDKHYAEKKQHFEQLRDEQSENYHRKIDLCLRAEAIAKREDWKKATEEILALQAEWKTIGPASRKVNDKVWQRFRGACDEFFSKKGEHFKDIRANESENLAQKQAIIEEIKAYEFGNDKDENLKAIKDFQRRWAEIGMVPIKEKNRLQKEYRALIDGIFEKLKISAREAAATAYMERLRNYGGNPHHLINNERVDLLTKIDKLRADLSLWENNLGFLANSKQADLLKEEFEKKMQSARQQIALMEAKLHMLNKAERDMAASSDAPSADEKEQ